MITFPITFILGDIINEYYGKAAAKQTVYAGLAMSILAFAVINIAQFLPPLDVSFSPKSIHSTMKPTCRRPATSLPQASIHVFLKSQTLTPPPNPRNPTQAPYNVSQASFDMIFGSSKMLYIASLIAYVIGNPPSPRPLQPQSLNTFFGSICFRVPITANAKTCSRSQRNNQAIYATSGCLESSRRPQTENCSGCVLQVRFSSVEAQTCNQRNFAHIQPLFFDQTWARASIEEISCR